MLNSTVSDGTSTTSHSRCSPAPDDPSPNYKADVTALIDLVRLLARQAAHEAVGTRCTSANV